MTNCSTPRLTSRPQWLWKHVALSCVLVSILLPVVAPINVYFTHHQDAPVPSEISGPSIEGSNSAGTETPLCIVEKDKWIAQPPTFVRKIKLPVPYVIICHTALNFCTNHVECISEVRALQAYHMNNTYTDIKYNFLVGGDGLAYVGRNWDYIGSHSLNYDVISIGIAFIGNFTSVVPPKTQLRAAQKLIEFGVGTGKIAPDYILLGNRQVMNSESPGDALYNEITKWPHWSSKP